MRHDIFVRQKLVGAFGNYAKDLERKLIVEPQAIIELTSARVFETPEWQEITERVEAMGGCWEHSERVWKIPRFLSRANLPEKSEMPRPNRLYVRSHTLQNLIFLHGIFKDRPPGNWKDIQSALEYFTSEKRSRRNKYSKAACRDYYGALLALQTR
jgi:hypothetical protein